MRSTICLFQDAVLDEVERQIDRLVGASRELFPVFVVGAPLASRGQLYNCGVVIHRGRAARRRPQGVSAELPRILRAAALHLGRGRRRPVDRDRRARGAVRQRSAVRRRAARPVSPFMSRSARICGCRSRRARPRRSPGPKSCSTSRPATSRSARRRCAACCAPRNRRAALPPMPIPPPAPAN